MTHASPPPAIIARHPGAGVRHRLSGFLAVASLGIGLGAIPMGYGDRMLRRHLGERDRVNLYRSRGGGKRRKR